MYKFPSIKQSTILLNALVYVQLCPITFIVYLTVSHSKTITLKIHLPS